MNEAQIKENNILISEFMGAKKSDFGDYMVFTKDNPIHCGKIDHWDIFYHTDWNWIMPVVEKISRCKFEDGDYSYPRTFGMINEEGNPMFRFNRGFLISKPKLIDSVYIACVDYIKQFNIK